MRCKQCTRRLMCFCCLQSDSSDEEAGRDSAMDGREPYQGRGARRDSGDDDVDDDGAGNSDGDEEGGKRGGYTGDQEPDEEGGWVERGPEQGRKRRRSNRVLLSDGEELEDEDVPPLPKRRRTPLTVEKALEWRRMFADGSANPRKSGEGNKGHRSGGGHKGGNRSGAGKPPPAQKPVPREREQDRRADAPRRPR